MPLLAEPTILDPTLRCPNMKIKTFKNASNEEKRMKNLYKVIKTIPQMEMSSGQPQKSSVTPRKIFSENDLVLYWETRQTCPELKRMDSTGGGRTKQISTEVNFNSLKPSTKISLHSLSLLSQL